MYTDKDVQEYSKFDSPSVDDLVVDNVALSSDDLHQLALAADSAQISRNRFGDSWLNLVHAVSRFMIGCPPFLSGSAEWTGSELTLDGRRMSTTIPANSEALEEVLCSLQHIAYSAIEHHRSRANFWGSLTARIPVPDIPF
jgi:hypothetical protein